jgi:glyoxylase-like metal-dependent hydrolase (beta-lactamase superfamily II)
MSFPRRQFLRAGLGLTAASSLPFVAGCAGLPGGAPSGTRVSEGVYRTRVGSATVTAIADGVAVRPLADGFVRNASLAQVQQALREANLPTDKVTIPFTAFVVELDGKRVLIDAGNGQFGAPTSGQVLSNLKAAGFAPESIDHILISHFHGDHINGLRGKDGQLVYPKAKIHVPAPEWDFWMSDANMAKAPEAMKGAFQAPRRVFGPIASQLSRFKPGAELLPGLVSMEAFGHTPGHTAFALMSGDRTWVFLADFANIPQLFVRNPDWMVAFDMDGEKARQTRRRLMDQAIAQDWLVSGYHMPFPAIGRVARRGNGYDFVPLG